MDSIAASQIQGFQPWAWVTVCMEVFMFSSGLQGFPPGRLQVYHNPDQVKANTEDEWMNVY